MLKKTEMVSNGNTTSYQREVHSENQKCSKTGKNGLFLIQSMKKRGLKGYLGVFYNLM